MSWKIKVTKQASKKIRRIPKKDTKRLLFVLEGFIKNPHQGDIEKLKGEKDVWRRRIGNYRILYEIIRERRIVWIFQIQRKTTTTYRKKN